MSDINPSPLPGEDFDEDVSTYPVLYWSLLMGFVGCFIASILVAVFLPTMTQSVEIKGIELRGSGLIAVALGLYLVAGIRQVSAQEIGGVFVFGKPTIEVSSTWTLILLGISNLEILSILTKEMEVPADPEHIFRGDGNVPEGMRPPTRITFAEGPKENHGDPLERRITAEVPLIFRFRIRKGKFFTFWTRVGDNADFTESQRQLEDIGVGLIGETLPRTTINEALRNLPIHNQELLDRVEKATESWGIDIITARIKGFLFSHELNKMIQSIPEAAAKKTATITTAEGDRQAAILAGEGRGLAAKAEAEARGAGLKKMADDLGISGADTLGADVARTFALGTATKIIVGAQGIRDIVGLGAAITETSKDTPPTGT